MLNAIESAKLVHMQQMQKIESEIAGKKIDNPTALGKMECPCGIWFYSNEAVMKEVLGLQLFERLDEKHEQWHKDYASIYNIFFKKEKKKGLFSKIIGSSSSDSMKIDKAKLYYNELKKDTQELLHVAESAQRRITALNDSKFQESFKHFSISSAATGGE